MGPHRDFVEICLYIQYITVYYILILDIAIHYMPNKGTFPEEKPWNDLES